MTLPNLHFLRRFVDRAESLKGEGTTQITHSEMRSVSLALGALLLYQRQLEDQVGDLQKQIADMDTVQVEMNGGNF
jgi:hypothetical protein